jgi:hypothetical protein
MPCYVYAYLDPRKPGIFKYEEYEFGYEPFYIGYSSRQARMSEEIRVLNTPCSQKFKRSGP